MSRRPDNWPIDMSWVSGDELRAHPRLGRWFNHLRGLEELMRVMEAVVPGLTWGLTVGERALGFCRSGTDGRPVAGLDVFAALQLVDVFVKLLRADEEAASTTVGRPAFSLVWIDSRDTSPDRIVTGRGSHRSDSRPIDRRANDLAGHALRFLIGHETAHAANGDHQLDGGAGVLDGALAYVVEKEEGASGHRTSGRPGGKPNGTGAL